MLLSDRVAIVGIGYSGFAKSTRSKSYKELMFDAASMAYHDSGVNPRRDVGSFVCCEEDFWEGISIADEYVPDQIGATLRPTCTVTNDGIGGLATAFMQIKAGLADVAVVEAHAKLSDVISKDAVQAFGYDPIYARELAVDPLLLAGLEMNRFVHESGNSAESCAEVAALNLANGLRNARASYGAKKTPDDILSSKPVAFPLRELETSKPADGCVVVVVASEESSFAKRHAIWIKGIGWSSSTPWIQSMDMARAAYARQSAASAYRMAGWAKPKADLYEVDDSYAYKELQHIEALGMCPEGSSGRLLEKGTFSKEGDSPVNVSGGSLGVGQLIEANGLHKVLEASLQLRGEAGRMQIKGARTALVQSWRGVPSSSGAVAILEAE